MVDVAGILGGAAQAREARQKRGLQERQIGLGERQLGLQREQFEAKTDAEKVAAAQQEIARITDIAVKAKANSPDGAPQVIATLRRSLSDTAELSGDPNILTTFDAQLEGTPTATEAAQLEGETAAIQTRAQTPAEAERARATAEAAARGTAAGTPQRPQTTIGKLVADVELAERQFGEDSPQAQAVREALDAERAGETEGGPKLTDVRGLRQEFTKLSGDFIAVRDSFKKIQQAVETPSAAGDVAMVFNFMKMLDPGSVVRESEFATAASAAGLGDRFIQLGQRALSGERLTREQREDFAGVARSIMRGQLEAQRDQEKIFRGIAERQNMDPANVVVDFIGGLRDQPEDDGGATAAPGGPPSLSTQAEVDSLAPGTEFIWAPTGDRLRKD